MEKMTHGFMAVLICFSLLFIAGCALSIDDQDVIDALEEQGYKEPVVVGKHIFSVAKAGCSQNDDACFKVLATLPKDGKSASGVRITLAVGVNCPFDGITVR